MQQDFAGRAFIVTGGGTGIGHACDIAELACFLLGDGARWITGQAISVDGGQSLHAAPD